MSKKSKIKKSSDDKVLVRLKVIKDGVDDEYEYVEVDRCISRIPNLVINKDGYKLVSDGVLDEVKQTKIRGY